MRIVTTNQMRQLEQVSDNLGVSPLRLMENAGASAVNCLKKNHPLSGKKAVLLAGRGNNGGDACVMARHLLDLCQEVSLVLTNGLPSTPQASEMYERLEHTSCKLLRLPFDSSAIYQAISQADLLVDGMYGLGFHGELSKTDQELLAAFCAAQGWKVAIDLPSGFSGDGPTPSPGAARVDETIVLGAFKPVHFSASGEKGCGILTFAPIGIPEEAFCLVDHLADILDETFVKSTIPKRAKDSHKGDFGTGLLVCGSLSMSGAALLATKACLRGGAGKTTLATVRSLVPALTGHLVENTFLPLPETKDGFLAKEGLEQLLEQTPTALLLGCGMGTHPETVQLFKGIFRQANCPMVIDADGLNILAPHLAYWKNQNKQPIVLTPHPGEMARLTGTSVGEIQQDRIAAAKNLAMQTGYVIVLKGEGTVIASPEGQVRVNRTGNPGLAKGGTGDLLAGLLLAFLAEGIAPFDAACLAVWIHGTLADRLTKKQGTRSLLASDLLEELPSLCFDLGL